MSEYRIGKVVAVTGDQVFVSLLDEDDDGTAGVPASMTVDVDLPVGGQGPPSPVWVPWKTP